MGVDLSILVSRPCLESPVDSPPLLSKINGLSQPNRPGGRGSGSGPTNDSSSNPILPDYPTLGDSPSQTGVLSVRTVTVGVGVITDQDPIRVS